MQYLAAIFNLPISKNMFTAWFKELAASAEKYMQHIISKKIKNLSFMILAWLQNVELKSI